MSEADKMFETLEYKQRNYIGSFEQSIGYIKDYDNVIYFYKNKTFIKTGLYDSMHEPITIQELKAINKKCEELGWI